MTASEIIEKYIAFFEKKKHSRIPNAPLVPENDPTTLFTSSGMQPLAPYLLGEKHPMGKRLVNVQNCFRAQDIDEVGDNRHDTFFRMLGNWSLGDYFKKDEISWLWELLTREFKLPKEKLFISIFKGGSGISYDRESHNIWAEILKNEGIDPKEKIFAGDITKNWWSRSGIPEKMPIGEIGGPDTEVYYKFDEMKHNENCQGENPVLCECGKYLEIANSVFIQYQKAVNDFKELPQKNVDYGGGVERLMMAVENQQDLFKTSLFAPIIQIIETQTNKNYVGNKKAMRIIADHLVASVFIAANEITPSNKDQGYVLRRLLRRSIRYARQLGINKIFNSDIVSIIIKTYLDTDSYLAKKEKNIKDLFNEEEEKFVKVIQEGLKKTEKIFLTKTPIKPDVYSKLMQIGDKKELFRNIYRKEKTESLPISIEDIKKATILGEESFNLYQSCGFPIEMIIELAQEKCLLVDVEAFNKNVNEHQNISRAGASKKFAGGLADHSEQTIKGHTATHLLHKALRDLLGENARQAGSNITSERIRFDFNFKRNLTSDELAKIEQTVNQKIKDDLSVKFQTLSLEKAKEIGAIGVFSDKYSDNVKVYSIGDYSKEICGGPHVKFTSEIKSFKIIKQENIGKGNRRIYAIVGK